MRNPFWSPEFTGRKPSFNNMGAVRFNLDNSLNKGLLGWWLLNEGAGQSAKSCVNGLNVFSSFTGSLLVRDGLLNANSQRIQCASPQSIFGVGTGNYCVYAQVTITSLSESGGALSFVDYDPAWVVSVTGEIKIYDGGNKTPSGITLTQNVKTSLVWNRSGTGANLTSQWINGIQGTPATHADSIGAPSIMNIGSDRDGSGNDIAGTIHQIAFWNRALSDAEIASLSLFPYGTPDNPRFIVEPQRTWFVPSGAGAEGAISGSSSGSATASGILKGSGKLAGIGIAVASTLADLKGAGKLIGSSPGETVVSGVLKGIGKLAGSADGVSTVSLYYSESGSITGSSAGMATIIGVLKGTAKLMGTSVGSSTPTAMLLGLGKLVGSSTGSSTASALLNASGKLAGLSEGETALAAVLKGIGKLAGISEGRALASLIGGIAYKRYILNSGPCHKYIITSHTEHKYLLKSGPKARIKLNSSPYWRR